MAGKRLESRLRGVSSVGRAPALQAGGRRFEPGTLHPRERLEHAVRGKRLRARIAEPSRFGPQVRFSQIRFDPKAASIEPRTSSGPRASGGTHISLLTMGLGFDSADAHIEYLTSVADALSLS